MQAKQELKKVCLFLKYNFHKSCMLPISTSLTYFGVDHLVESKRHKVYDVSGGDKGKYKVFVIADEWGDLFRENAEILCTTGHSMANKNTTFDSKNSIMDYIYVPSQYYKDEFIKKGISPKGDFIITGYPAATEIFREVSSNERKEGTFPRNILIAPTYNRDLSIMDGLIDAEKKHKIFSKLSDYHIIFKLHPVLPKKYPEQVSFCQYLEDKYKNVFYHKESHADLADFILWADLLLGDCSGALLLGAAGDIPIIACDNPNRARSEYFDKYGPEWIFRKEYAQTINYPELAYLPNFIHEALQNDHLRMRRKALVNKLFSHQLDADTQIAKHIKSLLE